MSMEISKLVDISRLIKIDILKAIHKVQTGHAGSSLSIIDILTVLYFHFMKINPSNPNANNRDRLILSKGHAAPALYGVLAHRGYFQVAELETLRKFRSRLQGHPKQGVLPGIDVSTGSLGQGLSIGLGMALAFKYKKESQRVFVILGDGELQEGQNWEAIMAASTYHANNLIAIVDRNFLQNDKPTEQIIKLDNIEEKFNAFGWNVQCIDGHRFEEIITALDNTSKSIKPSCIIANTVKGKGVSFMENIVHWHHHPISDKEIVIAINDLNGKI